ncbi:MAG TPA: zf-HC2 domain-containing protein [Gemmatimonadaceae bacterium]|nr:zf-HC2 domain-containing protein [Gemmatimonadaceae bacterium]
MSDLTPLTCEETFRRLDDYVDRELSVDETHRVQEHLRTCAMCAGEYAFEANVIAEVRSKLRRIEAPADLLRRISRRLASARDDQSGLG